MNQKLKNTDYLKKILTAKVYDVAVETPLEVAKNLTDEIKNLVLLKREDKQPIFSFKIRGAYNKLIQIPSEKLAKGVICASAGNHAQGVALSAQKLGVRAVIVMPKSTPAVKINAVRSYGAEIIIHGTSYSDAYEHAKLLCEQQELNFIHPFDDPDVIAGQGTIAMEILRQYQGNLDAVFVAIGGGGLIAGIASYIKAISPNTKIVGVQMTDSNAMLQSITAGHPVSLDYVGLFSDGTAVKRVGDETFRLCQELVDDYVCVDVDAVCAAIQDIFIDTRSIVEPAGAMGIAGMKKYVKQHNLVGKTFSVILCGANMNFDRLKLVAERAKVGQSKEVLFAVTIPEQKGSFKRFYYVVDQFTHGITEFNYRMHDQKQAHIFVGLSITDGNSNNVIQHFQKNGFSAVDLTDNDLAKTHIRHMVGGAANNVADERVLHFRFPDKPSALRIFLEAIDSKWNISLFHYNRHGSDYVDALVGLQVPVADRDEFKQFLANLAYPHTDNTDNPAYKIFLG